MAVQQIAVERAVRDERRLAWAWLSVAVALASAWLWVHATAPARPAAAAAPGQRAGSWRRLSDGPRGLWADQMVRTGTRALVFAGADDGQSKVDGARYDPGRDRWRGIRRGPLDWRVGAAAAWTGRELLVWLDARRGAAYDPSGMPGGACRPRSRCPGRPATGRRSLDRAGGHHLGRVRPSRSPVRRRQPGR